MDILQSLEKMPKSGIFPVMLKLNCVCDRLQMRIRNSPPRLWTSPKKIAWRASSSGETCKYLYLVRGSIVYPLFDEDNPLHASENKYIFTTEGHIVPIDQRFREKQWEDLFPCEDGVLAEKVLEKDPPTNSSKRKALSHGSL
ncbi:hypothetical protein CRUP_028305 [Coryphaenoides rupestris]|nr:hypothetical protein CRUP_028305 [Coryphaenoides rupestris]